VESQKKNHIMAWTIVVLLIMNLTTITLLWFGQFKKPVPFPMPGTKESLNEGARFLKSELNLSENQVQQFIDSRNRHVDESREIQNKIHQLKRQIVGEAFSDAPDMAKIQNLSKEIGLHQAEFERYLFRHFSELKSYCTPEQQEKLLSIFNDMAMMSRPPKPDGPDFK